MSHITPMPARGQDRVVGLIDPEILSREGFTRARLLTDMSLVELKQKQVSGYSVEVAGRVACVRIGLRSRAGGGLRGCVRAWSAGSRRRLLKTVSALEWPVDQQQVMVTLTMPGSPWITEGDQVRFPTPVEAKKMLENWRKRMFRRYGTVSGVWKMEFQRRGAVHFHLVLSVRCALPLFRRFVSRSWFEIVGSGQASHLKAGTGVTVCNEEIAHYIAKDWHSCAKEYQHEVPVGLESVGRWWGLWGMKVSWTRRPLTAREYFRIRRALRTMMRKRGLPRRMCGWRGLWVICDHRGEDASAILRL